LQNHIYDLRIVGGKARRRSILHAQVVSDARILALPKLTFFCRIAQMLCHSHGHVSTKYTQISIKM